MKTYLKIVSFYKDNRLVKEKYRFRKDKKNPTHRVRTACTTKIFIIRTLKRHRHKPMNVCHDLSIRTNFQIFLRITRKKASWSYTIILYEGILTEFYRLGFTRGSLGEILKPYTTYVPFRFCVTIKKKASLRN